MPRTLVIHDADRIQDYIFATGRLREIRGASALVDSLTTQSVAQEQQTRFDVLLRDYPDAEIISAAGGNVVAWFKSENSARAFDRTYSRAFYDSTQAASSTGCVLTTDAPYREAFAAAKRELQVRKSQALSGPPSFDAGGLLQPCQSCAARPASRVSADPDGGAERLCDACAYKRAFAGEDLPRIYRRFFVTDAERRARFTLVPRDFAEIGAASTPRGYIGVIYCDGNAVGKRLRALAEDGRTSANPEGAFRDFGAMLDDATRDSAVSVLRNYFPAPEATGDGRHYYPFQFILCGGDDLLVVVPADRALPIAADFIESFAGKADGVTTSAGVVLAKDRHPFRDLVRLSKDLLRSAKRRTRAFENKEGCLDAMVLTASGALDVEQERERSYQTIDRRVDLTPQPLTVAEFRAYQEMIAALVRSGYPTSKLYGIYQKLWRGYLPARLSYYDAYGRASNKERAVYDEMEAHFGLEKGPWLRPASEQEPHRSPFVLLAEWYEFLSAAAGEREAEVNA